MITFYLLKSYERCAIGTFEVIHLLDEKENDVTKFIKERPFCDDDDYDDLKSYIAEVFKIKKEEIYLVVDKTILEVEK
jgi:hypothetical protein